MTTSPNILFLFSDQHSAWGMSCAGTPVIRTPAMDRLAREGVRFMSAYCPTPLCVPARTALLTGRHGCSTGILRNSGTLLREEPTFPQALQRAGYRTAIIGKVHLAQGAKPGTPECDTRLHEMGFDDVDAHTGKVFAGCGDIDCSYRRYLKGKGVFETFREDYMNRWYDRDRFPNYYCAPSVLAEEDYHDAFIGRQTADYLEQVGTDRPFFLWCNWGGPHSPWDAPGRYASLYNPDELPEPLPDAFTKGPADFLRKAQRTMANIPEGQAQKCRASYYGMINVVDDAIARILAVLERRGMLDNTVIVYSSDHGEMMYDHGFHGKCVMYESSASVPLIVRWPQAFEQNKTVNTPVSTLDLVPTFLELAGTPAMEATHGLSLNGVLTGRDAGHREEVYCEMDTLKMLRRGRWKYVFQPDWETGQLFDLEKDPLELDNLAGTRGAAEVEADMHKRLLSMIIHLQERPNTSGKSEE